MHGVVFWLYRMLRMYLGSTIGAGTVLFSQIVLRGHAKALSTHDSIGSLLDFRQLILRGMPRTLRSASALAASWQCQRCGCTNNTAENKRRCFFFAGPGGTGKLRRVPPASRSPMLTEAAALRFAPMRTMRQTRSPLGRFGVQKRGEKRESLPLEN